jgi:ribonuclease VapC
VTKVVLDASAIIAYLNGEPGAPAVETYLSQATCLASAANYAEALTKLIDWNVPEHDAKTAVDAMRVTIIPLDGELAAQVAALRASTRQAGLSLGDRVCLALARRENVTAVTADRPWLAVATPLGISIECIRPDAH